MNMLRVERQFYTIRQLSEVLGLSESSIRSKVARHQIKTVRLGGRVLIPTQWVQKLINKAYDESQEVLG
jgi:excisionase family DNA binding protein|tara:strand:+ start:448 stop:654 length:207 start_codon:yes stop_codon:yes gene_type:complete